MTSWTIDTAYTARVTSVDQFKKESFTATDGVTYQYASYEPQEGSDTLFVWLHGGGEGGVENTDSYVKLPAAMLRHIVMGLLTIRSHSWN